MIRKLFFLTLSFIIFHFSFLSYGMAPDNLDDYFSTCLKQTQHAEFNPDILPSRIYGNLQIIHNLRFFAEIGPLLNPKHLPYSQCINVTEFPQTALTRLLQIFFSSPDGATLTPNQSSDPVASLTATHLGRLLTLVENYLSTPSDPGKDMPFKQSVYTLLNPKKPLDSPNYQTYLETQYADLCLHEFKMILATFIAELLPLVDPKDVETLGLESKFPLTNLIKIASPFYIGFEKNLFEQGALKEKELEDYLSALDPSSETELSKILKQFKTEREMTKFKSFRFTETLLDALKEQLEPSKPLPPSLIQRLVFSFLWKKFKPTPQNGVLPQFLEGYLGVSPETFKHIKIPPTTLSKEDYWRIRQDHNTLQMQASLTAFLSTLKTPLMALLSKGYKDYEDPLPSFIPYYKTRYKGSVKFSDCCESTIFNLLRAGLKSPIQKSVPSPQRFLFPEEHPLRQALEEDISDEDFSQTDRDTWAERCSGLPNVRYLKSSQGKDHPNDCEITPGFKNALNVMRSLDPLFSKVMLPENNEEGLSQAITILSAIFSQKGNNVTWRKKELDYNHARDDWFGTLIFSINAAETYEVTMDLGEPGHGFIERSTELQGWQTKTVLPFSHPPEMCWGTFSASFSLEHVLPTLSESDQITLAHSVDLRSYTSQRTLIYKASLHPLLIPFTQNLIRSIFSKNDEAHEKRILPYLISPYLKSPFLTEIMYEVFKRHPALINYVLPYPFSAPTTLPMLFILLSENKMNLVEHLIPLFQFLDLNFIGNIQESLLLTFFQTWLPKFSNLQTFSYQNLYPDAFKHLYTLSHQSFQERCFPILLRSLKDFQHLSDVNFYVPLTSLGSVIEAFPPSLTVFSMLFLEGYTYPSHEKSTLILQEDKWKELIPCLTSFFTKHPQATFNLSASRDFSETDQGKIKEIFTKGGISLEKLQLYFNLDLIDIMTPEMEKESL